VADIELTLDRPGVEPGGEITGIARWTGDVSSLVVELGWETRGKGDRDAETVATTTIPVAGRTEARFTLTAPHAPFSFSGTLISVVYLVTVRTRTASVRGEVVIAPGGEEVILARA
jgi:hypothetical protein